MNADVKAQWVAALMDPERKQTTGALKDDTGECCLGVLCDIAVKNNVIPEPVIDDENGDYLFGAKGDSSFPPEEVQYWAGLENRNPYSHKANYSLSLLNDSGLTFSQIADIIEDEF